MTVSPPYPPPAEPCSTATRHTSKATWKVRPPQRSSHDNAQRRAHTARSRRSGRAMVGPDAGLPILPYHEQPGGGPSLPPPRTAGAASYLNAPSHRTNFRLSAPPRHPVTRGAPGSARLESNAHPARRDGSKSRILSSQVGPTSPHTLRHPRLTRRCSGPESRPAVTPTAAWIQSAALR